MKKKLKVFTIGAFCAVLLAGVILPFSACTPISQESDINQTQTLNLDPENDEIVAYTNGGIPIRSHALSGTEATSYQYITLGTYNGNPINWILVAVSDKGVVDDVSPTGQAIKTETDKDTVLAELDSTLECGQVRLISECVFVDSNGFANNTLLAASQRTQSWSYFMGHPQVSYPISNVNCPANLADTWSNYTSNTSAINFDISTKFSNYFKFLNQNVVIKTPYIATCEEYQKYLNNYTLCKAKQFNSNNYVSYLTSYVGNCTVLNDSITKVYKRYNSSNAHFSWTGSRTSMPELKGFNSNGYVVTGQNLLDANCGVSGNITATLSTSGWAGDMHHTWYCGSLTTTFTGQVAINLTNIRPMMVIDITKL